MADPLTTPILRTVENKPGVVFDASKTKTFFAEDFNTIGDALDNHEERIVDLEDNPAGGAASPIPYLLPVPSRSGNWGLGGPGQIRLYGFILSYSCTISRLMYIVTGNDGGTALIDVGIYNSSGQLVCHVGPTAHSSNVGVDAAIVGGGSVTLNAGEKYYFAFTGNATGVNIALAGAAFMQFCSNGLSGTSSSAGTLPSSISLPNDSWSIGTATAYIGGR